MRNAGQSWSAGGFAGRAGLGFALVAASACGVSGNVSNGGTSAAAGTTVAAASGATSAAASATGISGTSGASTAAAQGATSGSTAAAASTSGHGATTAAAGSASGTTSGVATATTAAATTAGATHGATSSGTTAAGTTIGTTSGAAAGTTSGTTGTSGTYAGFVGVLQRSNDLARDAVFVDPAFTKAAISQSGALVVDSSFNGSGWAGPVFASPLYFVDTAIGKDLVIVATESNEVYALDATDGSTVWSVTQLVAPIDNTTNSEMGCSGSGSIGPPIGITGTPVIDPTTRTLYLDALTSVGTTPEHQIYALNLDNGTTLAGWPVNANTVSTVLTDGTTLQFNSSLQWQRGALTLVNGTLYVSYGGINGDCGDYHGWVIAVDTAKPTTVTAYATDVNQAGIWGPSGPASDGTNLYVTTGNGRTSQENTTWLQGEALLKLGPGATYSGNTTDYFYPSSYVTLDQGDTDLGSTEPVLFDFNDTGGLKHLVWAMGKTDNATLLDRDNLGGAEGELSAPTVSSGWLFGSYAAYHTSTTSYVLYNGGYNGTCPGGGGGDTIALVVTPSTSTAPITANIGWCGTLNGNKGGAPIVSTPDGTSDPVVWGLGNGNLTALDGTTGAQIAQVSVPVSFEKWLTPIIAKGRLFVVGDTGASAFKL